MSLAFVSTKAVALAVMLMLVFAGRGYVTEGAPIQRSACANLSYMVDPQMQGVAFAACAGTDLARIIIADKLRNTQILLTATMGMDGRYNVATGIATNEQLNLPNCDFGNNWYLMTQFEKPNPAGDRMEVNQRCILGVISAEEVTRRVAERLAKMDLHLDDADWEIVQRLTELVLREWANGILGIK